ncbi:hypothetical protein XELAEV_18000202mg [Xenopus laevis]|uniref:Uncharacterized protein n=1 Tax=Xenopus laevis TaxID=8355 RepID=A0A974GZA4_XENLA|nr:hypothetical protein XELAEV_18000202mg [Xenopus laevis]
MEGGSGSQTLNGVAMLPKLMFCDRGVVHVSNIMADYLASSLSMLQDRVTTYKSVLSLESDHLFSRFDMNCSFNAGL